MIKGLTETFLWEWSDFKGSAARVIEKVSYLNRFFFTIETSC